MLFETRTIEVQSKLKLRTIYAICTLANSLMWNRGVLAIHWGSVSRTPTDTKRLWIIKAADLGY